MRKAAYILGTICVILSLCGAVLKLISLPGGAILLILFTSLFSIAAMPLYLYPLYKSETESGMKFALRLGGYSFAVLQVGLLFYVQRWPGETEMIYAGAAGHIVFLIMFVVNVRKPEAKTKGFSVFGLLAVLLILTLGLASYDRRKDNELVKVQYAQYQDVLFNADSALDHSRLLLTNLGKVDTVWRYDSIAIVLINDGLALVEYIESMKREIVLLSNYGDASYPDTTGDIRWPLDKVTAPAYMIGPDISNPTGAGIVLYNKLNKFRKDVLPADVAFSVPVADDQEQQVQWVKDNFYNATILESLSRLTMVQKAICTSVNSAIETKAHIE